MPRSETILCSRAKGLEAGVIHQGVSGQELLVFSKDWGHDIGAINIPIFGHAATALPGG